MAERIETYDWARTSVGPREHWPASLRILVDVALQSRFPMLIWWGRDLVQIYNDAYVPLFGARHPAALGQTAQACWPEVWDRIEPMLERVVRTGEPVWGEDMPFTLERNGYPEEAFFTFSYSRIGEPGEEGGVLCTNVETTASVKREAQFRAMADNMLHMVYLHAADGTIAWSSSRWYDYTQLPREIAITPAGWARVVAPDDFAPLTTALEAAFANGEGYEIEIRIKPDGSGEDAYRWHLLRAVPLRGESGEIERWVGSATDIHDRRVAETALRDRLERDFKREHEASLAFQNAALPQTLPTVAGLHFDAIYEAAGEDALVGGDWYDAFALPDGRVVISVGDVVGKGLDAAVTMGAARQAIRGAAQVFPEPAAVLDAADRALRSEQPERVVTAFLGVVDPFTHALWYASAGHPAPLLRHADGSLSELRAPDLPLGLRGDRAAGTGNASVLLPPGSMLVLYTDGLTEATRDIIAGEHRLHEVLAQPGIVADPFPAAAIRAAAAADTADDVAILTMRVEPESDRLKRWSFRSGDADTAVRVRHEFAAELRARGVSEGACADAELVFGELLGNVVRHTDGDAEAALDLTGREPVLHVLDRGPGFTFYARLPKDSMSESGRGLYITTMLARDVSVVPRPDGGSHARVVLTTSLSP